MEYVLLMAYGAVFVLLLLSLRRCLRGQGAWKKLISAQLGALAAALLLLMLFDALPGKGMMPGLTYFAHSLFSMGAAAVYALLLLITLLLSWRKK